MQCRTGRLLTTLAPVFAAMIVAGCTADLTSGPKLASLVIVSGTGQSGPIGAILTQQLRVKVVDQSNLALEGIVVTWQVTSGGGVVTPSQSTTDATGEATASWRLGTTQGSNTVTASLGGGGGVVFTATATSAPPSSLVAAGGDAQTGVVATVLPLDLVVKATDAVGNPKPGVLVSFAAFGGGTLSASSGITDAAGLVSVKWTLGTAAGQQTVVADVNGVAPVTFTANAQAGTPETITVISGNNQSGAPGAPLPDSLRIRLNDKFGNPVAGVTILWTPIGGSGTASPSSSTTDANGRAATRWTLGSTGGPKGLSATGGGLTQQFAAGGNVTYSSISAGGRSSCGITVDAVLLCWGYNGEGQLGIGQGSQGSGPVFAFPQPTAASGNLTFRQTVTALYHACAVTMASVGYCWGVNHDGRLGTNNVGAQTAPTQILSSFSFRMMAVSRNHTCGLSLADRVYCWGYSGDGQIGIGPVAVDSILIPVEVLGALRFQTLAAGGQHTCAITTVAAGSEAYCWGYNASGQLGDASNADRNVPVPVSGGLALSSVSVGYNHSCALDGSGLAYCWGSNASGQLGTSGGPSSNVPVAVSGGLSFSVITSGENHSCGLTAAGALYCWGRNANGQLGDGSIANRNTPTLVSGGITFKTVSAGDQHTCAVTTTSITFCWGDNQFGQLGDGTLLSRLFPVRVAFQP